MKKICPLVLVTLLCSCSALTQRKVKSPDQGATPADAGQSAGGQSMFDFTSSFSNSGSMAAQTRWNRSASEAIAQSKRTGLPLLILFTHQLSQPGVALETILSGAPELGSPDAPHFIPLRVDYADQDTAHSDYYKSLKTRYNPNGYPVLLAALPDGTEVARQTGYNKEWKSRTTHWINYAKEQAQKGTDLRRKEMEKYGYRNWSDKQGTQVWARLEKVDANQAIFVSEWGESFRTFISRLSDADQARLPKNAER